MLKYSNAELKEFVTKALFDGARVADRDPSFPRLSIVTPSYQKAPFLERAILSVLNQNYPNLEYIVIDGGSSDESKSILMKYQRYLSYWISERDQGQSDALNKGFARATGEIVGWLNADDFYLPRAFLRVADLFRDTPEVDVIFGDRVDVDEEDAVTGELRFTPFSRTVLQYDGMCLSTHSTFWRRDLFSKVGGFDPSLRFSMDYEFFLRAAEGHARFRHVQEFFGGMRRYSGNKTDTFLDTPEFAQELRAVDSRHGRRGWVGAPLKAYALLYRTCHYVVQGDWDYVLKGIKRRAGTLWGEK